MGTVGLNALLFIRELNNIIRDVITMLSYGIVASNIMSKIQYTFSAKYNGIQSEADEIQPLLLAQMSINGIILGVLCH